MHYGFFMDFKSILLNTYIAIIEAVFFVSAYLLNKYICQNCAAMVTPYRRLVDTVPL